MKLLGQIMAKSVRILGLTFKDKNEMQYVLLYEDFPGGEYFDDGLSHEAIKAGDDRSISLKFDNDSEIPNVIGWFTLYREI